MKISVVMPAFNSEATIADTLESVFAQQYQDLEVIVVDDASSDNTAEKVRAKCGEVREKSSASQQSLESSAASLRLVCMDKNSGPAAARNRGIAEAKGEWIAFLDADDEWLPEKLEIQMKAAAEQPDVDMWCGEVIVEDKQARAKSKGQRGGQGKDSEQSAVSSEHSGEVGSQKSSRSIDAKPAEGSFGRLKADSKQWRGESSDIPASYPLPLASFAVSNPVATSTVLVRKVVLEEVGGFDEQFRGPEDYDLWMRIAAKYKIMKVECPLTRYCLTHGSLSQDDRKFLPQVLMVIDKAYMSGGCLSGMAEMKNAAVMIQYNHASWMAFCRGSRITAIIYLLRSQILASMSFNRTGVSVPDPFLPLLLRYAMGRPEEGVSRIKQLIGGLKDRIKRWKFIFSGLVSEPCIKVHMKVENENDISPDCGDGWLHVYKSFTKRHPKCPFVRMKEIGVSMLPVPDDFDMYISSVNGKNSPAYYARKAHTRGYYITEIDRNEYIEEILELKTSNAVRQGRPIPDHYWIRKDQYSVMPNYSYLGVFDSKDKLVGCSWVSWYNQVAIVAVIMGHADYLNDGIMYALVLEIIKSAVEKKKKGHSVQYIMYDSFFGATSGMIMFKRKLGFTPYRVKWLP